MNQVITLKIYCRKEPSTTNVMVMTTKVECNIKISIGGVSFKGIRPVIYRIGMVSRDPSNMVEWAVMLLKYQSPA